MNSPQYRRVASDDSHGNHGVNSPRNAGVSVAGRKMGDRVTDKLIAGKMNQVPHLKPALVGLTCHLTFCFAFLSRCSGVGTPGHVGCLLDQLFHGHSFLRRGQSHAFEYCVSLPGSQHGFDGISYCISAPSKEAKGFVGLECLLSEGDPMHDSARCHLRLALDKRNLACLGISCTALFGN